MDHGLAICKSEEYLIYKEQSDKQVAYKFSIS